MESEAIDPFEEALTEFQEQVLIEEEELPECISRAVLVFNEGVSLRNAYTRTSKKGKTLRCFPQCTENGHNDKWKCYRVFSGRMEVTGDVKHFQRFALEKGVLFAQLMPINTSSPVIATRAELEQAASDTHVFRMDVDAVNVKGILSGDQALLSINFRSLHKSWPYNWTARKRPRGSSVDKTVHELRFFFAAPFVVDETRDDSLEPVANASMGSFLLVCSSNTLRQAKKAEALSTEMPSWAEKYYDASL